MASQPNKHLAKIIAELLDCSLPEATKVLKAIFLTIKEALLRGEKVSIRGFGTFKLVERTHRPTPGNILTNFPRGRSLRSSALLYYTPRPVLIFEPSLPLMARLNLDSPNYKERRTQRCWQQRHHTTADVTQ